MFDFSVSLFIQQQFQKLSFWISGLTDEQVIVAFVAFILIIVFAGILYRKIVDYVLSRTPRF